MPWTRSPPATVNLLEHDLPAPTASFQEPGFPAAMQRRLTLLQEHQRTVLEYLLQRLLNAYPHAPAIAVICDNGSTHHSGITKRRLAGHPRIQVIEGAKYRDHRRRASDQPFGDLW